MRKRKEVHIEKNQVRGWLDTHVAASNSQNDRKLPRNRNNVVTDELFLQQVNEIGVTKLAKSHTSHQIKSQEIDHEPDN